MASKPRLPQDPGGIADRRDVRRWAAGQRNFRRARASSINPVSAALCPTTLNLETAMLTEARHLRHE